MVETRRLIGSSRFRAFAPALLVGAAFLVLPFWWLGDAAVLGGDDTRLYFVYPWQWLQRFALPAFGGLSGFGTYSPQQHFIPFTLVWSALQAAVPSLNLEAAAFGVALSSGFWGTYAAALLLIPVEVKAWRIAPSLLAGLLYVTAPLIAAMYWVVPLAWVMGVGGAPVLLALSAAYLKSARPLWLLLLAVLSAYYAIGLAALPVALPFLFGAFLIVGAMLIMGQARTRLLLRRLAILAIVLVGANAFWWLPLAISSTMAGSFGNDALGSSASAGIVVRTVSHWQSILDTLLLLPSGEFERNNGWQSFALWGWTQTFIILSLALPGVVAAALLLTRTVERRARAVLLALVIASLALAYGQTVNVSSAGVDLFATLSTRVPLFGMFRNFYNKFTAAYTLYYVLALAIALSVVLARLRAVWRWVLMAFLTTGAVLQAVPMLAAQPLYLPMASPKGSTPYIGVGQMSPALLSEAQYLARLQTGGRILELPLSANYWSESPMLGINSFYVGSSPLKVLSGLDPFNSLDSFAVAGLPELQSRLDRAIKQRDYATIGAILRLCGIRYLSYTVGLPEGVAKNWLRQPTFPLDADDMSSVATALRATKVATFSDKSGATRVLYTLPASSVLPRVFVTSRVSVAQSRQSLIDQLIVAAHAPAAAVQGGGLPPDLPPIGIGAGYVLASEPGPDSKAMLTQPVPWRYHVEVRVTAPSLLVLLEPVAAGWSAHVTEGSGATRVLTKLSVDGYASGWVLPTTGQYDVDITYGPQQVTWIGGAISALTLLAVFGPIVASLVAGRVRVPWGRRPSSAAVSKTAASESSVGAIR